MSWKIEDWRSRDAQRGNLHDAGICMRRKHCQVIFAILVIAQIQLDEKNWTKLETFIIHEIIIFFKVEEKYKKYANFRACFFFT